MKNLKAPHLLLFLSTILITLHSCKKEDPEIPEITTEPAITTNEYFPVSVGSYWVYEFDTHHSNGTIDDNNYLDTLRVVGDTLIEDETYFVFNTNLPSYNTNYYRRIDQGEVVAHTGALVCPPDNSYTGVYNNYYEISGTDTIRHYWEEFSGYEMISTSLGPDYSSIQKTIHHKTWPILGDNTFADTIYYSPIGILQRSYSYFSGSKRVGTLIDYHIE